MALFARRKKNLRPLVTDVHSHLLPALDDGVKTWDEALNVIEAMAAIGYEKLITTPHIIADRYPNTEESILQKLTELRNLLQEKEISVAVEAAAEYYLDDNLYQRVVNGERLLSWGNRYLLFETNFITEPFQLKDFIFKITTLGYKPVLAHPERYQYMDLAKIEDLKSRGVLLQVNLLSFVGRYPPPAKQLASKLVEKGWVDFLGSDCHNPVHAAMLPEVYDNRTFKKALELPLLNRTL